MACFFTDPAQKRLVLKPIRHQNLWDIFKEQQSVLWTTEEIDLSTDSLHWDEKLTDSERSFIKMIWLTFFLQRQAFFSWQ